MSDIGRGAYLDLRDKVVPVVDELVENSHTERIVISFHYLKGRTGILAYRLYNFFSNTGGTVDYLSKDEVIILKPRWHEFKERLDLADPSFSLP
jgi:hypothetical protein